MSASTEPGAAPAAGRPCPWRAADAALVLVSLAGLACGLFCAGFLPGQVVSAMAHPPALQTLLACQAGYLLLLAWQTMQPWRVALLEYLLVLLASAPLYAVAAWVSDATVADVVRGLLYLTSVALGAGGLGLWAANGARPRARALAALLSTVLVVALPALYYLLLELAGKTVDWLWWLSPVTCAFSAASSRAGAWHPSPLWAWAFWPTLAALSALAGMGQQASGFRLQASGTAQKHRAGTPRPEA